MRRGWKVINIFKILPCLLITILFCAVTCGCSGEEIKKDTIKVNIVDSIFFHAEPAVGEVNIGEDFTTVLHILPGYTFESCDYKDYETKNVGNGNISLTLKNVTRPSRITVKSQRQIVENALIEMNCKILYDFNGGKIEKSEETDLIKEYKSTQHIRPNTWNGAELKKNGYTLIGWNTAADGSGEHIGLGSRVTVEEGSTLKLFAEWRQWIDSSNFLYRKLPQNTIELTGYLGRGDIQPFVVPSMIDGMKVTEISESFTTNMPCGSLKSATLILSDSIQTIKDNAFLNSSFSEIYFWDNLKNVGSIAFPYNFKTYHINAVEEPRFQAVNNSIIFADIMDRLIVNADKQKIIFFSGCSFTYGVQSQRVDDLYGEDYVVLNLGVNGDINGAFQIEMMLPYIGKGDLFIHAPEQMSPCQLMNSFYVNSVMFVMIEGNYDLLSHADFSFNGGVFKAFFDYSRIRSEMEPCSYSEGRLEDFNIFGDFIYERPYDELTESERDVTYSDNVYCYDDRLLNEKSIGVLTNYYNLISQRGAKVCVSYAPVNESAREEGEIIKKGKEFADKFEKMLAPYGYKPISKVEDYIFLGRYFYDSDYHLNELGAAIRTAKLLEDLQAAGLLNVKN